MALIPGSARASRMWPVPWEIIRSDVKRRQPRGDLDPQHRAIMRPVCHTPAAFARAHGCREFYSGLLAFTIGTPLALGSRWALLPAALSGIVLIVRTVLEDPTLQAEWEGYAEYTVRVRSRLVPLVW